MDPLRQACNVWKNGEIFILGSIFISHDITYQIIITIANHNNIPSSPLSHHLNPFVKLVDVLVFMLLFGLHGYLFCDVFMVICCNGWGDVIIVVMGCCYDFTWWYKYIWWHRFICIHTYFLEWMFHYVLLFLCDSKVSLAVARRASDVWDLRNSRELRGVVWHVNFSSDWELRCAFIRKSLGCSRNKSLI